MKTIKKDGYDLVPISDVDELILYATVGGDVYSEHGNLLKIMAHPFRHIINKTFYKKVPHEKPPVFKYAGMIFKTPQGDYVPINSMWIFSGENKYKFNFWTITESSLDKKIASGEWKVYTAEQLRGE